MVERKRKPGRLLVRQRFPAEDTEIRTWVVIALLLVAGYLLTGVVEVRPGERAVVQRFGRVVATPGPGLWVGLPWGMDRVERVPMDMVRRVSVGYRSEDEEAGEVSPAGQLLTGDHNLVNVQVGLQYVIEDVVSYIEQGARGDALVGRVAESVLAEWIGSRDIDDVLIEGKTKLPGALVEKTQRRLEPYRLGISIRGADIALLQPPREVRDAFAEVNRAQTSIRTREHEARQEAARILREAEIERFRIERETEAYVTEQVRLARAEVDRFERRLEQYQRLRRTNPDYLTALWWEEIGKLFTQLRKNGHIDLLDNRLGKDGLDIMVFPLATPKTEPTTSSR